LAWIAWESVFIVKVFASPGTPSMQHVTIAQEPYQEAIKHMGLTHDDMTTSSLNLIGKLPGWLNAIIELCGYPRRFYTLA
jgi:hypothetical protein